MTLDSYINGLKGRSIAVIGVGVSNRPLLKLLLDAGCDVTARDARNREKLGEELSAELEQAGCRLRLGEDYLGELDEDVIFRTPGRGEPLSPRRWRRFSPFVLAGSPPSPDPTARRPRPPSSPSC